MLSVCVCVSVWSGRGLAWGVCPWFLWPRSLTEQININEFAAVARKVIIP